MYPSTMIVFKEIIHMGQTMFIHFKLSDCGRRIVPSFILSAHQHWALLATD